MGIARRSRPHAFAASPALARQIADWQRSAFVLEESLFAEGEQVWLDLDADAPETLTAEQAEKLNRETAAEFERLTDPAETLPVHLPAGKPAFLIAEWPAADMATFAAEIGPATAALAAAMGWFEIAVMPMVRAPILSQDNDFEAAASADEMLRAAGLDGDFDGALCGPPDAIAPLIGPLFWIARCNASAPYIAFGMEGAATAGVFCKYANYHFETYDAAEAQRLEAALRETGFDIPEDGMCEERFSDDGAIEGRRLDLG